MFHDGSGEIVLEAASQDAGVMARRLRLADLSLIDDAFTIIDDAEDTAGLVADPPDYWERVRSAGYRSVLIVRVKTKQQHLP
jgi:hypothetical protein